MRIKRYTAPDMRAALRMVRDEQGPDAVILSNRTIAGGVEVVSATDYDEALVQQALRAATPGFGSTAARSAAQDDVVTLTANSTAASASNGRAANAPTADVASAGIAATATTTTGAAAAATPAHATNAPRPSLAERARAVFRIGPDVADSAGHGDQAPTLAQLVAPQPRATTAAPRAETMLAEVPRFEATMAALGAAPATSAGDGSAIATTAATEVAAAASARTEAAAAATAPTQVQVPALDDTVAPPAKETAHDSEAPAATPTLRAVGGRDFDPAVAAMRDELSAMRQLIERELGQLTVERLRGSPARAAAYDALIDAGCEPVLAQDVAAQIDPGLDPDRAHAAMLAQFGQRLTVARAETIDDGGVIALVGPTGAGKTTTLAKLAARFAARHRARDVALVTTDCQRAGAREQLQAHGRRLGITVCEADGPDGLPATLAQLADYPLVLVDTAGHAARGRAMLGQLAWLRGDRNVRSLLVLPANANPHDLDDVVRRYRLAAPEGVVLTKLDETGRLGAALSMAVRNDLSLAYVCDGQDVPGDIAPADIPHLLLRLSKPRRGDATPSSDENRHAVA